MLTLIALTAALMQQQPPAPPAPSEVRTRFMFVGGEGPGALDKDGDGQVTREEFTAPMNDHFARMDTDGDGRLSGGELSAGHGAMGEGGGHDLMIMRGMAGHGGPGVRRFELRRQDGEGGARAEHDEGRTVVFVGGEPGAHGAQRIVIHGDPGGPAWAGAHAEGGPGERIEIRRMGPGGADDLDADNDGRISEAEFGAPLREAFARMDADRSGFIESVERGSGAGAEVFVHRIETRQNHED